MNDFADTGLPDQVIDLLADTSGSSELHLVLRNIGAGYTAIRDDDLPLAREIALMLVAFFGATLTQWAPMAIATLILFIMDIRKKGITVSTVEGLILKELRSNAGLTSEQLSAGLSLSDDEVEMALKSLNSATDSTGRAIPLVEVRDEIYWHSMDV